MCSPRTFHPKRRWTRGEVPADHLHPHLYHFPQFPKICGRIKPAGVSSLLPHSHAERRLQFRQRVGSAPVRARAECHPKSQYIFVHLFDAPRIGIGSEVDWSQPGGRHIGWGEYCWWRTLLRLHPRVHSPQADVEWRCPDTM